MFKLTRMLGRSLRKQHNEIVTLTSDQGAKAFNIYYLQITIQHPMKHL